MHKITRIRMAQVHQNSIVDTFWLRSSKHFFLVPPAFEHYRPLQHIQNPILFSPAERVQFCPSTDRPPVGCQRADDRIVYWYATKLISSDTI